MAQKQKSQLEIAKLTVLLSAGLDFIKHRLTELDKDLCLAGDLAEELGLDVDELDGSRNLLLGVDSAVEIVYNQIDGRDSDDDNDPENSIGDNEDEPHATDESQSEPDVEGGEASQ